MRLSQTPGDTALPGYAPLQEGMMHPGWLALVTPVVIAGVALRLYALVDALRVPTPAWNGLDHGRRFWIAVIVAIPFAGAAAYLVRARSALHAAARPA